MTLWKVDNGKLRLPLHHGQTKAWESNRRFVFILAGTQSGKTSYLPWWLERAIRQTATPEGNNDYIATTASYDLFKLKFLPEMRQVFEHLLGIGRYWTGERIIELKDPLKGFWAKRVDDPMYGRIILRSAASPSGLESATAKAAIMDEAGQDEYTLEIWEAILRRLSLSQGRVCAATTLYNLGWIKSEIYDAWKNGDSDIDVIQFASIQNPAFPKAEFERAKSKMQDWRFAMFYLGQFAKPAGLIYSAFTDSMLIDPFAIPDDWPVVTGVDFGGANTATLYLAQNPDSEVWYIYKETLEGDKSSAEHVESTERHMDHTFVGGAGSETQYRMDWEAAGLPVLEPPIKEVENGIDKVVELMKLDKLRVFRTLHGLRDELGSYRRKLDASGNPTEEIMDKRKYHRCFIAGTLVYTINGNKPIEDVKIGDFVLTRFGYRPVTQCHTSKALVRSYIFSNGKMLIATPNHPVYVSGKGYIELQALQYPDIIETSNRYKEMFQWQTKRLSNLMESNIQDTRTLPIKQMQGTSRLSWMASLNTCTVLFGSIITALYQKVIRFTTKMNPLTIMRFIISTVLLRSGMVNITLKSIERNVKRQWTMLESLHQSGIGQKRGENGTGKLASCLGLMQSRFSWYARIAKRNLRLWLDMAILNFAPMLVNQPIGVSLGLTTRLDSANFASKDSQQISIVRFDTALDITPVKVEVYNLSIESNEYFANDILVHNCDALRYAATYINQPLGEVTSVLLGQW